MLGLTLRDNKDAGSARECRKYAPHADVLVLRQDALGAGVTAIIDEGVGVPPAATSAHLSQPRPNVMRRAANSYGVIDRADWPGNQVVSGKSPRPLAGSGSDLEVGVNRECRECNQYPEKCKQHLLLHVTRHRLLGTVWLRT